MIRVTADGQPMNLSFLVVLGESHTKSYAVNSFIIHRENSRQMLSACISQ